MFFGIDKSNRLYYSIPRKERAHDRALYSSSIDRDPFRHVASPDESEWTERQRVVGGVLWSNAFSCSAFCLLQPGYGQVGSGQLDICTACLRGKWRGAAAVQWGAGDCYPQNRRHVLRADDYRSNHRSCRVSNRGERRSDDEQGDWIYAGHSGCLLPFKVASTRVDGVHSLNTWDSVGTGLFCFGKCASILPERETSNAKFTDTSHWRRPDRC